MSGKTNSLLYSTSLWKFPEFIDLPLSFYKNFESDFPNVSKLELNKKYFDFLLNFIPNVLENFGTKSSTFFKNLHYIFSRYPDAFKNELKLDYENMNPSYKPPKISQFDKNKFYAFPLSVGEINRLLPTKDEIASNIHQMNAVQLKNTLINWYYLLDTMKPIKISLEDQYAKLAETEIDQKAKIKEQIDSLDEKMNHFEKLIKDSESNLKEITLLKDKHQQLYDKLDIKDNTNNDFDAEDVVFRIGYFKNDETMKFSEFFDKLHLYAKSKKLSEDGIKSILSMLLKDEPFQVFMDLHHQDADLEAIMNALASQYSDKKTITQYSNMLRNFQRKSGESLRAAMSRCSTIISMTSHLVPHTDRNSRKNFLQQEYLLRIASNKAIKAIKEHLRNSQREGITVSYETLLNLAVDAETDEDYFPF